jgi:Flp pilus assembly protein TadG
VGRCRRLGRRIGASDGQATVELALLMPVLMIGLLAVIQVALVARDRVLVVHATREAARAAAVEPDPATAARAAAQATGLDADRLSVSLGPQRAPGERLTVSVTYRAPTSVPLVGRLVGDVVLRDRLTIRVE